MPLPNPPDPKALPVEMRPYRTGDEDAVNRAFNEVFAQQRSLAEWRWKFQPAANGSQIMLAVEAGTGEVLAQFAVQRVPVRIDGKPRLAGHSVDDFCRRRSDLAFTRTYMRLSESFHRDYGQAGQFDFLYGFPGTRHLNLLLHHEHYEQPEAVPYLLKVPGRAGFSFTRWRVGPMESEASLTAFEARCAARYPSAAVRDGTWLRRRYLSHPGQPYRSVAATCGGTISAWAVFRRRGDQLVLGDLLWDGQHPAALRALDRWAVRQAQAEGAAALAAWLHGDREATEQLLRLGWQSKPNPLALAATAFPYSRDLPERLLPTMYFTMGDSDLF